MKLKLIFSIVVAFVFVYSSSFACDQKVGTKEGQCAPDFSLPASDGRVFSLYQHRGKVVVVNFWATWCEPCIEEIPSLEKLYNKKLQGVELVSISMDQNQQALDRFFAINKDIRVTFPILQDFDKKVSDAWGTFKVPETYIIDAKGVITDKIIGIYDWQDPIMQHYLMLLAKTQK